MDKKLTAQGPKNRKSYTVTLPIDWVKQHRLDALRQIQLEIVGNNVVLSPQLAETGRMIVDLNVYTHSFIKVLQGCYRLGIDELKIIYKDHSQLEELNQLLAKLIGYEIVEQKQGYVIVKDITKEASESFDTVLRRIFLLLLELSTVQDKNHIKPLDTTIKKLINYCQRILVKSGYADYQRIPFYYILLDQLEKITDEYTWVLPSNEKCLPEINGCLRKAYESYYQFTATVFDGYAHKTDSLRRELKAAIALYHYHNLARLINSLYGTIFVLKFPQNPPQPL